MHKLLVKKKIYDALVCTALLIAVASLVLYPEESVDAAKNGLTLCANVIIPSLFPFFVLTTLIVQLGLSNYFGRVLEPIMRPLFNVNGACATAFVLGFIGGYPVGAKAVISLYENGDCTKAEAERLLSFCNNSGPAFIFGVVGAGIFSSGKIGLLLYLAHTAASVCIGLLFRRWGSSEKMTPVHKSQAVPPRLTVAFTDSVKSSFQSTINICGFVIFFTVIIKLLFISGVLPFIAAILGHLFSPFGFDEQWAERFLTGLIELSSGVWTLQAAADQLQGSIAMAAFMLGWAGVSIHCQVLSFIGGSGLSVRTYIIGKILHGLLSAVFVFLIINIFALDTPVAAFLAEQVTGIVTLNFTTASTVSCLSVIAVLVFLILGALLSSKKSGKLR